MQKIYIYGSLLHYVAYITYMLNRTIYGTIIERKGRFYLVLL